jgi:hypothetical protein
MTDIELVFFAILAIFILMLVMTLRRRPRLGYLIEGVSWGLASAFGAYTMLTIEASINPEVLEALFQPLSKDGSQGLWFFSSGNLLLLSIFLIGMQQRATSEPMGGLILSWLAGVFGTFFGLIGLVTGELGITRVALEAIFFAFFVEYAHLWVFPKRKIES